jgi:predicted transcriptional regulator of viral defense system
MLRLDNMLNEFLAAGKSSFSKSEVLEREGMSFGSFNAAAGRLMNKGRIAKARSGFFVIVRPEDREVGPDPVLWIDALMAFLNLDYRISLLSAAAFHGASHQAGMVFQVVVPRQLPGIRLGRRRVDFIYQEKMAFELVNDGNWLERMKGDAGFVKVAGVELTLFDCVKYVYRAGGLNNVAQIVKDLGAQASPTNLRQIAKGYGPAVSCRLGYLLEWLGYGRQGAGLSDMANAMKSYKPLVTKRRNDIEIFPDEAARDERWKLLLNEVPEVEE